MQLHRLKFFGKMLKIPKEISNINSQLMFRTCDQTDVKSLTRGAILWEVLTFFNNSTDQTSEFDEELILTTKEFFYSFFKTLSNWNKRHNQVSRVSGNEMR